MTQNILLYSTSAAAQVWSALLVFWIVLIRDRNMRSSQQVESAWNEARFWGVGLFQALREEKGLGSKASLKEIGLDEESAIGAETDIEACKKVLNVNKARQLVTKYSLESKLNMGTRIISGRDLQARMDALADRISMAEKKVTNPTSAFSIGVLAICFNIGFLLSLNMTACHFFAILIVGFVNALGMFFFVVQAWPTVASS